MRTLQNLQHFYGEIAFHFPMYHSLTGCDTTSYYHYRGKTIPWNCVAKCPLSLLLTEYIGKDETPSDTHLYDYAYNGKPNEDLLGTKAQLYNAQALKKTSSLPPDPNSLPHNILYKHHQAYTWRQYTDSIILQLPYGNYV